MKPIFRPAAATGFTNVEVVEAAIGRRAGSGSLQCTYGHSATCRVLPSLRVHFIVELDTSVRSCTVGKTFARSQDRYPRCLRWQCDHCASPDCQLCVQQTVAPVSSVALHKESLDSILNKHGWPKPCAIKIDTEGSEFEVVQGVAPCRGPQVDVQPLRSLVPRRCCAYLVELAPHLLRVAPVRATGSWQLQQPASIIFAEQEAEGSGRISSNTKGNWLRTTMACASQVQTRLICSCTGATTHSKVEP